MAITLALLNPPLSDHHFLCLVHLLCYLHSILCLLWDLHATELTPSTIHQSPRLLISLPLPLGSVACDNYPPFAQALHFLGLSLWLDSSDALTLLSPYALPSLHLH